MTVALLPLLRKADSPNVTVIASIAGLANQRYVSSHFVPCPLSRSTPLHTCPFLFSLLSFIHSFILPEMVYRELEVLSLCRSVLSTLSTCLPPILKTQAYKTRGLWAYRPLAGTGQSPAWLGEPSATAGACIIS
jgi:hypothetical protein